MTFATITVGSHHFVVTQAHHRVRMAMKEFSSGLKLAAKTHKDWRGQIVKQGKDKYFAAFTDARTEVRYHINHLEDFKKLLYRHQLDGDGMIVWNTIDSYEADPMELEIRPHFIPDPVQVGAIEYIVDTSRPNNKAVIMQAGSGKTLTTMMAAAKQGERMCIMIESGFIGQWLEAFQQNCIIKPKRIAVIKGSKALKALMFMADEGNIPYDAILISNSTYRNYIEDYETHADRLEAMEGYVFPPYQFFEKIKAGMRVIDEGHENFHFVFKLDLYTHVRNSVTLSATLFSDETFKNNMMKVAYPMEDRFIAPGFNKYVHAYSLHYSMRNPREMKTQGSMGYSHVEFEKSLVKSKEKLTAYFRMVRESMRYTYEFDYRPNDRCLVYFATIDLCTRFVEYIQKEFPHLDVKRYVDNDPLEHLMTADISVSTVKSAGTGKDIPQLTTVIMTPAINASPSNIQGFGRLRDLNRKDPTLGRKMHFVYFCGDDFLKHLEYHERKKELLRTRALHYEPRYYGTMI
jgi:hypothetical protein